MAQLEHLYLSIRVDQLLNGRGSSIMEKPWFGKGLFCMLSFLWIFSSCSQIKDTFFLNVLLAWSDDLPVECRKAPQNQ